MRRWTRSAEERPASRPVRARGNSRPPQAASRARSFRTLQVFLHGIEQRPAERSRIDPLPAERARPSRARRSPGTPPTPSTRPPSLRGRPGTGTRGPEASPVRSDRAAGAHPVVNRPSSCRTSPQSARDRRTAARTASGGAAKPRTDVRAAAQLEISSDRKDKLIILNIRRPCPRFPAEQILELEYGVFTEPEVDPRTYWRRLKPSRSTLSSRNTRVSVDSSFARDDLPQEVRHEVVPPLDVEAVEIVGHARRAGEGVALDVRAGVLAQDLERPEKSGSPRTGSSHRPSSWSGPGPRSSSGCRPGSRTCRYERRRRPPGRGTARR